MHVRSEVRNSDMFADVVWHQSELLMGSSKGLKLKSVSFTGAIEVR